MRSVILFFTVLLFSSDLFSQCQPFIIDNTCTTVNSICSNTDFINTCNSSNGWSPSHGTPQLTYVPPVPNTKSQGYYYFTLVADNTGGEGVFKPFNFISGQSYTIQTTLSETVGTGGFLYVIAARGLVQHQQPMNSGCQGAAPTNATNPNLFIQTIGTIANATGGTAISLNFVANDNYTQLWLASGYNNGGTYTIGITGIQICSNCSLSAPTGLTTSNNSTTLNWNAPAGAASGTTYSVNITEINNGVPIYTTKTGINSTSVPYCTQSVGNNVSFTVQSFCSNGGVGATSSAYAFTSTSNTLSAPSGVSYNASTNTITWASVNAATAYNLQVKNITTNTGVTTYGGLGTNSISGNTLELTGGDTYQVSINGYNSCSGGPWSGWYQFTVCPALPSPGALSYNSSTNILTWSAVTGASGYNIQIKDITANSGVTTYGGLATNSVSVGTLDLISGHVYQVSINAYNYCSVGSTWSSWYQFTIPSPCPAPSISSASNPGGSPYQIAVTWQAVSGGVSYNLQFTPPGTSNTTTINGITGTSYTFTSPTYTSYSISIQAVCANGTSSYNPYDGGSPVTSGISPDTGGLQNASIFDGVIDSLTSRMSFKLFPVPSSSQINLLYISKQNEKAEITIVNYSGMSVMRKQVTLVEGHNNFTLNVRQLANGIYVLKLNEGINVHIKKFTIQK